MTEARIVGSMLYLFPEFSISVLIFVCRKTKNRMWMLHFLFAVLKIPRIWTLLILQKEKYIFLRGVLYIWRMGVLHGQSSFFKPGPPAKPGEAHFPLVRFLMKEIRGKNVLDLGGGEGAYSLELKKAGYDVVVADINADSLKVASNRGLETLNLDENKVLGENVADTVILIEVLEHVPDPRAFLQTAMSAARKRVLFSLPCTDDFKSLFNEGLTFAHIAVSDHLWHFSYQEMRTLLDSLNVPYQLQTGDFLFPRAPMNLLRQRYSGPLGYLGMLPLRLLNKLKLIPESIPSRFYGVIEIS